MNGPSAVQCRSDDEPGPHRRLHGDGLHAVRAAGPGDRRHADRRHRRRGRGMAAAGVGRHHLAARHRSASRRRRSRGPASSMCVRAGRRHRDDHAAVHGRARQDSAGHRQCTGIPWPARRRSRARKGPAPLRLAGPGRGRRRIAHPTVGRRRRPGRRAVSRSARPCAGPLHPAHPAGRRRGRRHQRLWRSPCPSPAWSPPSPSAPRCSTG